MKWLNWLKKLFWEKEETSLFYMQGHDVLPQPLSREDKRRRSSPGRTGMKRREAG